MVTKFGFMIFQKPIKLHDNEILGLPSYCFSVLDIYQFKIIKNAVCFGLIRNPYDNQSYEEYDYAE